MTSKEMKAKAAAYREERKNNIEVCGVQYSKQDACKVLADIIMEHLEQLTTEEVKA